LRILTWNVNHRARRRHIPDWIAASIAEKDPDVLVLTEHVEGDDHDKFVSSLKTGGLGFIRKSERTVGQNQILIASKQPLRRGLLAAPELHEAVPWHRQVVELLANADAIGTTLPFIALCVRSNRSR
jgi:hypothetical protein